MAAIVRLVIANQQTGTARPPLDRIMRERKITNQQLAEVVRSSETTMSKWRRGQRPASALVRHTLAEHLGVTEQELGW